MIADVWYCSIHPENNNFFAVYINNMIHQWLIWIEENYSSHNIFHCNVDDFIVNSHDLIIKNVNNSIWNYVYTYFKCACQAF